jgi:hypothetical protein
MKVKKILSHNNNINHIPQTLLSQVSQVMKITDQIFFPTPIFDHAFTVRRQGNIITSGTKFLEVLRFGANGAIITIIKTFPASDLDVVSPPTPFSWRH